MKKILLCFVAIQAASSIVLADSMCLNPTTPSATLPGVSFNSCNEMMFADPFYITSLVGTTDTVDVQINGTVAADPINYTINTVLGSGGYESFMLAPSGEISSLALEGSATATITEESCTSAGCSPPVMVSWDPFSSGSPGGPGDPGDPGSDAPEPLALLLAGSGLAVLGLAGRRFRRE